MPQTTEKANKRLTSCARSSSGRSSLIPRDSWQSDSKIDAVDTTRLRSTVGMSSRHSRRTYRSALSMCWSNAEMICSRVASGRCISLVLHQVWITGAQPTAADGTHTMPQRETVAGEATLRSSTSNSMRIVTPLSLMRSPLGRHSVRLSSSTVFMFSIQTASTGPSKTIHLRSGEVSLLAVRMMVDPRPSVHSLVSRLKLPYSSPMEMDLGLSVNMCVTWM
mmetsp:Transcript_13734/g.31762  ORF Transcript_13734/g.31762 Transcript_13734/m.31762 type:complete len:221 (-) Transcript_13734:5376-6038(-)